jgi:site-specific recombinase XerD
MVCLLYGAGLRVLECCRLRVQDVDFGSNQIVVRGGKGEGNVTNPGSSRARTALSSYRRAWPPLWRRR